MQSYYEKLVAEQGREAANRYMSELQKKRRKYPGPGEGNFSNPAIRRKAIRRSTRALQARGQRAESEE